MLQLLIIIGMLDSSALANQNCLDSTLSKVGCKNLRIKLDRNAGYFVNEYGVRQDECESGSPNCLLKDSIVTCSDFRNIQLPTSDKSKSLSIEVCQLQKGKFLTTGYTVNNEYIAGLPECPTPDDLAQCNFRVINKNGRVQVVREKPPEAPEKPAAAPAPQTPPPAVTKTEACTDCLARPPQPTAPKPVQQVANSASDIARAAAAAQPARPLGAAENPTFECKSNFSIPNANPDLYFFNNSRTASDPTCSFNRYMEYKKYVDESQNNFGVHKNLLLCLMQQESRNQTFRYDKNGNPITKTIVYKGKKRTVNVVDTFDWDPKASSDTGAIGLGQFVDRTLPDVVGRILEDPRRSYQTGWTAYFRKFGKDAPQKDDIRIDASLNDKKIQYEGKCDSRCEPDLAIAAKGLYLRHIMDSYGNNYENRNANPAVYEQNLAIRKQLLNAQKIRSLSADESARLKTASLKVDAAREYMVFIAGAYNRGPGAIEGTITAGTGAYTWQNNMIAENGGARGEVASHMKRIRNCMRSLEN